MKIKFTNYKKNLLTGFLLFSLISLISCNEDPTPSLADLIGPSGANPQITSVEPPSQGLAGVTKIVINGSNFSADTSVNLVFFGTTRAKVLEASPSRLVVLAPNVLGDSLEIKVAAEGDLYSNKVQYSLNPAILELQDGSGTPLFNDDRVPYAITIDKEGNLYVSTTEFGSGAGIKKITPSGDLTDFAPKGGETFFANLKYGPGGILYTSRNVGTATAIFQIEEGTAPKVFLSSAAGFGKINDFDFDSDTTIWAGGTGNDFIYSITPAKIVTSFPFDEDVQSIRVFNNSLYILSTSGGSQSIWHLPINSSASLGSAEKYFDVSGNLPAGVAASVITFAADGDLYIGTNYKDGIFVVHPDKSLESLYPGLVLPNVYCFSWGLGNFLYYTRESTDSTNQSVFKLDMEKPGAPQYMRDL